MRENHGKTGVFSHHTRGSPSSALRATLRVVALCTRLRAQCQEWTIVVLPSAMIKIPRFSTSFLRRGDHWSPAERLPFLGEAFGRAVPAPTFQTIGTADSSIVNCQLSTVHCQLSIVNYPSFISFEISLNSLLFIGPQPLGITVPCWLISSSQRRPCSHAAG